MFGWVTAWLGLSAAATTLVAIALVGTLPDDDDGGVTLAKFYVDHRGALLAASILLALSGALSIGFWAGLRRLLRGDSMSSLLADIGLGSAVMIFAMGGVGAGAAQVGALLAGRHGGLDPATADMLTSLLAALTNLSAAPTLLLCAAFGIAIRRTGALPSWLATTLFIVGVAHVLALVSVADSGAFRPGGLMTYVGPILYLLWLIAAPVALLRHRR
jgi:hypothetical protein